MAPPKKPGAQIRPRRKFMVSADLGSIHHARLERIRRNHQKTRPLDSPLAIADVLRTAIDVLARELGVYVEEGD